MFVQKRSADAITPTRGSDQAAGLDLYSPRAYSIEPGARQLIPIDISISIPIGTYAHILPRSGLAVKYGIHVGAGVVDSDYRGNVGVLLFNLGQETFHIQKGDRIAQMVVKPHLILPMTEVETLDQTDRNQGGFGSSGK